MPSMDRAKDIIAEVLLGRPDITPEEADELAEQIVDRLDTEADAVERKASADGVR